LYDIANILVGVGIIRKVSDDGVKGYEWVGAPQIDGNEMDLCFAIFIIFFSFPNCFKLFVSFIADDVTDLT
jgi:energy-converting hydrogenase Eha subunit G